MTIEVNELPVLNVHGNLLCIFQRDIINVGPETGNRVIVMIGAAE